MLGDLQKLPRVSGRFFALWLVVTLVSGAVLIIQGDFLRNELVPAGILSLELNFGELRGMLDSYSPDELGRIGFGLGFDYLFLPLYGIGIAIGLLRSAQRKRDFRWVPAGIIVSLVASLCDAIENAFLYFALVDGATPFCSWGATIFASIKFGLLFIALALWFQVAFLRKKVEALPS